MNRKHHTISLANAKLWPALSLRSNVRNQIKYLIIFCFGCQPFNLANGSSNESVSDSDNKYSVVFHRPGKWWDQRSTLKEIVAQHVEIYKSLAHSCDIILSGRFEGSPVLGMSVFSHAADMSEIQPVLERDPAVTAGIVQLEFRRLSMQFGQAPACQHSQENKAKYHASGETKRKRFIN
ncbi:MAG: hypothetical protein ACFHVJ_13470 [Aestuariibacter sp.]